MYLSKAPTAWRGDDLDAYAESLKTRVAASQARIKAFTQDYYK